MKWKKGRIEDSDGKSIDCWRSDCKKYLFYLNINKGMDVKKGEKDKHDHRWWLEVFNVPAHLKNEELRGDDEKSIGIAPTKAIAKELALCEAEDM